MAEIKGRLVDACNALSPITVFPFSATDALNAQITGTASPCGVYYYCVEPGTQVTPLFSVDGYATTAMATLDASTDAGLVVTTGNGLAIFCNASVEGLPALTLTPPFDPTLGILYLHVSPEGTAGPCDPVIDTRTGTSLRLRWTAASSMRAPSSSQGTASSRVMRGPSATAWSFSTTCPKLWGRSR
jgi:hypothetical protein